MDQERYSRQILYKNIGLKGQQRMHNKCVLIVGMGALGTHIAEGLVRAGLGNLYIVDRDYIEWSNLQRQTLYTEEDANQALPKVVAAEKHLTAIRSDVNMTTFITHVTPQFLETHARHVDVIIDATDNFETRQVINDFAYAHHIPWIYGGVVQSTYVSCTFIPGETPCFNCVMPQLPTINMTCDTVGVIQPAVTMTTSLQLRDALKLLVEAPFIPKLTYGDIWDGEHHAFQFARMHRTTCETCGETPTFPHLTQHASPYARLCGRDTVQFMNNQVTWEMMMDYLEAHDHTYVSNAYMIRFKFKGYRFVYFKGGRFLIHGMTKIEDAQTIVRQMFG